MNNKQGFLRIAAIAAAASCVTLLLMAFIAFPGQITYPGVEVLTGVHPLSAADDVQFSRALQQLYILDTIFLFGWFLSWIAVSTIAKEKHSLLGLLGLIFGVVGAACDVGENSIIWAVMGAHSLDISTGTGWVLVWKAVQQMSYWLPFIGAMLISISLLSKKAINIILFIVGTAGSVLAAMGIFVPALEMFSNVWFLLWFACLAIILWQHSIPDKPKFVHKKKVTTMAVATSTIPEKSKRTLRIVLFTLIYFVEGFMLTYSSGFNAPYLRSFDISYTQIGLAGGIALFPFILKIFIGLLSDKVNLFGKGHRKPYIVIGLALQVIAFIFIPLINPANQWALYLVLLISAALGMSTYDTASDGFSIDTTPEEDRGLVQGLMVGGRALSSVFAAWIFGILSENGNWTWVFYMTAIVSTAVLIYTFFVPEDITQKQTGKLEKGTFKSYWNWGFILFLVLGMVYPLALYSSQGMVSSYLNEGLGYSMSTVGQFIALFGVGTIFGGVIGGPMMKKLGEKTSILAALLLTAAVTFILAITGSGWLVLVVIFIFGFCFGYYETVYMAMGMEYSDPRIAAFMFSIVMAVGNFGIAAGAPLAGVLVDNMGFQPMFMIFAGIHLVALPVVFGVFALQKPKPIEGGAEPPEDESAEGAA